MGTNEQIGTSVESTHRNANTATAEAVAPAAEAETAITIPQHRVHIPSYSIPYKASPSTRVARKIRRAFSMPRNPFRWSQKAKFPTVLGGCECTSVGDSKIASSVGGGRGRTGSIVSLNSNENVHENGSEIRTDADRENVKTDRKIDKEISGSDGVTTGSTGSNRVLRRSSFRKFLSRIAQHVSNSVNVGANKHVSSSQAHTLSTADRVPPISGYQWPADQTPGVMGLKNHGNTCFMNAVLQCLSHTDLLAEYFVLDQYKADLKRRNKINSRKFGTKGELTEQLANVLKALWTCKNESDHSTSFKAVVDRYGSQFRSSTQHDAQEFLFWLLDKVHEDLNTATKRRYKSVKNTYGRPDEIIAAETLANHIRCNNSFVQAVFQAQFRSSLTCPRCKKQSNTFDPFHCISVQLPQLTQQTIFVTVVYLQQQPRQVKLGLMVPAGSPIVALREQLRTDTGIASERMVLVDINKEGFTRVFYDTQPVATLTGIDTIYCIEVPAMKSTAPAIAIATPTPPQTSAKPQTNETNATAATAAVSLKNASTNTAPVADLLLLVANVRKTKKSLAEDAGGGAVGTATAATAVTAMSTLERFGMPFSLEAPRDCSYADLQKKLLREMASHLKADVLTSPAPLTDMFQVRLQDPSADPDTYLEQVEHPLLTEMIDLALSVLSAEAGPAHIKLLLEWPEPEKYFADLSDNVVEHESVSRLLESKPNDTAALTLEQCLEHYTKAETLSAEDAWRCPHCQQYLPVVKTLGLWSLPDILVVHFKRFRQHHEKGSNAAKLTTMVKFPLNAFDMAPHLARGPNENCRGSFSAPPTTFEAMTSQQYRPSPWKKTRPGDSRSSTLNSRDNKETCYDLYAVCYHQGDTLETGHYTAACKNPYDRQWYKFDDQRVTKVPHASIQDEIINNEAYMLFYQRRLSDAAESSGSSSNSGDHWVSRIAPLPSTQTEKLIATNEKSEEEVVLKSTAVVAAEEKIPEKAETKPVEIPKVNESEREEAKDDLATVVVTTVTTLAQPVVIKETGENTGPEKLDYAAADVAEIKTNSGDLQVEEKLNPRTDATTQTENNIFIMDEDCDINEVKPLIQIKQKDAEKKLEAAPNTEPTTKTKSSPLLPAASLTATAAIMTNGHGHGHEHEPKHEKSKSPNGTITPRDIRSESTSNTSISSSSGSSLSSRASPHSLAVSIHGATTLQTKFNGFSASSASANNYKEALLSSSLKSNSSSIIGAAAAAHQHEFQLSRHQKHNWNGSRSSVSAMENASQQVQHHPHGLNLRHSFSTSSNYKLRECSETLSSMLRNSANTCSKDTLIFIDQQNHHHNHHHHHSLIEDDDDSFMGSRSLWISPVTPHKLITVSPKN